MAQKGPQLTVVDADGLLEQRLRPLLEEAGYVITRVLADVEQLLEAPHDETTSAAIAHWHPASMRSPVVVTMLAGLVPTLPVVAIVDGNGAHVVRRALAAGARGVVLDDDIPVALVPCLEAVLAGQICTPGDHPKAPTPPVLSFREKQVLELVARGLTNAEIGDRLYLAESTVKSHLSTSFRKLDVHSRAEAAALVLDPVIARDLGMSVAADDSTLGALAEQ